MKRKGHATKEKSVVLEEIPELDDTWFREADLYRGDKLVRRGRPPAEVKKEAIHIRLDADVLAHFRRGGPGWQSRINAALKRVAKRAG